MTSVRSVLEAKGGATVRVAPEVSVRDALRLMRRSNVGALVVCDQGNVVGLFAERQFVWSVAARGPECIDSPVSELMEREVLYVSPDATIDECMALMTDHRTRHLPVLDDEATLVGIVSIGDVVKEVIADKDFIIDQLERYVAGR